MALGRLQEGGPCGCQGGGVVMCSGVVLGCVLADGTPFVMFVMGRICEVNPHGVLLD